MQMWRYDCLSSVGQSVLAAVNVDLNCCYFGCTQSQRLPAVIITAYKKSTATHTHTHIRPSKKEKDASSPRPLPFLEPPLSFFYYFL